MTISVLQWNVWYREDIQKIAGFLKDQNADIVCLQELTINAQTQTIKNTPAYIAKQLGYNYYCQELPLESTTGEAMMLANGIFSRFPITEHKFVWVNEPQGQGGYDDEYRAYVEATLDVGDQPLTVGTTHLSYTHRFEATPNKRRETKRLQDTLGEHRASFIFTGDLNAPPDSFTISSIERLLRHAGPDGSEKTWTTKPFSYQGFEETQLNWRLDYIFVTEDVQVLSSRVLSTPYSDHLPILAQIAL